MVVGIPDHFEIGMADDLNELGLVEGVVGAVQRPRDEPVPEKTDGDRRDFGESSFALLSVQRRQGARHDVIGMILVFCQGAAVRHHKNVVLGCHALALCPDTHDNVSYLIG